MHLLTETAIGDSVGYEILPFEEVEDLKREYTVLSSRVEGAKRKLALETKLRDAAQSLRRLHSPKSTRNGEPYLNGGTNGTIHESDEDEFAASSQKCEELAQELWTLERRAQEVYRRLLEHNAGILQLTHRGLKKNINRSGTNQGPNGVIRGSALDFDDRSLYKTVDGLDDVGPYGRRISANPTDSMTVDVHAIRSTEQKLEELNGRLRAMILQGQDDADLDPLPQHANGGSAGKSPALVQAHLAYLENSLNAIQTRGLQTGSGGGSAEETEAEIRDINSKLHTLLGQAGSRLSPSLPPPPSPSGQFLNAQMDYLRNGFEDLLKRVEGLQDQKVILTTQIQQQRELNSKSDAERDAHVADLTQQLLEARKQFELSEREVQGVRDELSLVMEQLDSARQQQTLQDQQRTGGESTALSTEKNARVQAEEELSRLQQVVQQESEARSQAEREAKRLQDELSDLEGEVARAQTELTVVKAELDGAYGTRAQRAAEAAAERGNVGQGDLQRRVEVLEKELRDTIEDYEVMTKASVEFEKEHEKLESVIDSLRDRCEQLESQLSDERITWMGINSPTTARDGASETTSTMVLKNEFKKMMRDTRAENMKLLKVSRLRFVLSLYIVHFMLTGLVG